MRCSRSGRAGDLKAGNNMGRERAQLSAPGCRETMVDASTLEARGTCQPRKDTWLHENRISQAEPTPNQPKPTYLQPSCGRQAMDRIEASEWPRSHTWWQVGCGSRRRSLAR